MIVEPYQDAYAEAIAKIIRRNLLEVNTEDYDLEEMTEFAKGFRPQDIIRLNLDRDTLVVTEDSQVLATGSIRQVVGTADFMVWTMFVDPDHHRHGIGSMIMAGLEAIAREKDCQRLIVPSSITAAQFYEALNYSYSGGKPVLDDDKLYRMEKVL